MVSLILVGVIGALFQSQEEVVLRFAIWETPWPLSIFWWLVLAFVMGVLLGVINNVWFGFKRRLENRRLRQDLAKAEAELARLKDVTLQS